jgi:recombination protein RecA
MNEVRKNVKDMGDLMMGNESPLQCDRVSTQCPSLDVALGGGLPIGRIIEIFGEEGSGKTTVALHVISATQQLGGIGVIIDVENALSLDYAKSVGVNVNELIFSQPDSGESALNMAKKLMLSKKIKSPDEVMSIIIDSAAALSPQSEIDGEIEDNKYAPVAVLLSKACRQMKSLVHSSNSLLIFTNQLRDSIGGWNPQAKSTGGKALKFYASVRMELSPRAKILDVNKKVIGQTIKAKIVKNKTFPPFKEAEFKILWGEGIDYYHSLFVACVTIDIIVKEGSWYVVDKIRRYKFHGETNFVEELNSNEKLVKYLLKRLAEIGEEIE